MKYEEYTDYSSEIGQLENLLQDFPDDMVIERMGLEHRLRRAIEKIEGIPVPPRPKRISVTLYGKPVMDGSGVDANFGTRALSIFSDAVRLTTAGLTGIVCAAGQVPRNILGQPVITGVALGSFSFELEVPTPTQSPLVQTQEVNHAEEAVKKVQELLTASGRGSDDELSAIAEEMTPRAVMKVGQLLDLMQRREAQFAVHFEGEEVWLDSRAAIEESARRLGDKNVRENSETITGTLIGVIPATRRFQLDRLPDGLAIEGRISREIRNPLAAVQPLTNRLVTARIRMIQVGRGAPRYTLMRISEEPTAQRPRSI